MSDCRLFKSCIGSRLLCRQTHACLGSAQHITHSHLFSFLTLHLLLRGVSNINCTRIPLREITFVLFPSYLSFHDPSMSVLGRECTEVRGIPY